MANTVVSKVAKSGTREQIKKKKRKSDGATSHQQEPQRKKHVFTEEEEAYLGELIQREIDFRRKDILNEEFKRRMEKVFQEKPWEA